MTRALVVGKFYPPHAGHHELIDSALGAADHVVVCVLAASHESIPMDLRAAWLRERHPAADVRAVIDDHPLDYDDPAVYDLHDSLIRTLVPERIDLIVSGERYGEVMAERYGCAHLTLPRAGVSGTAVRADPPAHWHVLEPAVRAYLAKRVVIVGAESTGTTTLARALADRYGTEWVPEYGREVSRQRLAEGRFGEWSHDDFHAIARRQQADIDAAARRAGSVLFADTDALATGVWEERYLGRSTVSTRAPALISPPHLYVLTADDIGFVQDGVRDGESIRGWMTGRFREVLREQRVPWIEVTGSHEKRMRRAAEAVDGVLRWDLAPPLLPPVP